jgi:arylsulfatase A-like enzyme
MTGKYPARLHITDWITGEGAPANSRFRLPDWRKELPLEEITLAEALKPLGYTSACIGKWHLGGRNFYPKHQGFDVSIAGAISAIRSSPGLAGNQLASRAGNGWRRPEGEYLDRLTDER